MKKIMTKPVLAVVTAAGLIGCLTPIFADASSSSTPATKVVMSDEGKQVTRYNLKELAKNDPATLNMLLKNQADHLYLIVDPIHLNTKLQTYMETNKSEWERIYRDYYGDIWLEVRRTEADEELVSVSAQTENGKVYIKGIVTPEVTKVVVTKPNGDFIEAVPTSEYSFTVSFAAPETDSVQYVTVQAYAGSLLADSEKVKLIPQADEEKSRLIHAFSVYDAKKAEWQVKGVVKHGADKVVVSYNGVKQETSLKKLWDGVDSFSVTVKDVKAKAASDEALVEIYEDGKKVDSDTIKVDVVNPPDKDPGAAYAIAGTAVHDLKKKSVQLKGTVKGWDEKQKAKLVVVTPDGKKKEIKPNDKGEYTVTFTYKNRSFAAKTVHLELYAKDKLVKQADIALSTKITAVPKKDDDKDDKDKDKHHYPNGKAYGYWKNYDGKWKDGDKDDRDDDRDDDDDDDRGKRSGK
ncbi:hypothetical protein [Brevibacillus agri]|uniref:hypothetical protein n=1 Tax=Brevibacillus agri TaxID=51101 RepID=UPI00046F30BB|nr:hypothetical protein [Brevibacillus agri]